MVRAFLKEIETLQDEIAFLIVDVKLDAAQDVGRIVHAVAAEGLEVRTTGVGGGSSPAG